MLFNTDNFYEFESFHYTRYLKKLLFESLNKTLLIYFKGKYSFAFMW
jgi:hypothetical protein